MAMGLLGNGLSNAEHHVDALSAMEARLSLMRRVGAPARSILSMQNNLAIAYQNLGRFEESLRLRREVYSGRLKFNGKQHSDTFIAALNYASTLSRSELQRFEETKSFLVPLIPVARRALGESDDTTLKMRSLHARVLYTDPGSTLDDIREAVTTLEDTTRITRRVLGGAHPLFGAIERDLQNARTVLAARETPPSPLSSKSV